MTETVGNRVNVDGFEAGAIKGDIGFPGATADLKSKTSAVVRLRHPRLRELSDAATLASARGLAGRGHDTLVVSLADRRALDVDTPTLSLGISVPGGASPPAVTADRMRVAEETGRVAVQMAKTGLTPDKILTTQAFENALRVLLAIKMYRAGFPLVGWYLIPKGMKPRPEPRGVAKWFMDAVLEALSSHSHPYKKFQPGMKIGDTINVRRPTRYLS
jgi:hypothetical protein